VVRRLRRGIREKNLKVRDRKEGDSRGIARGGRTAIERRERRRSDARGKRHKPDTLPSL